jgi:hypothetical protein
MRNRLTMIWKKGRSTVRPIVAAETASDERPLISNIFIFIIFLVAQEAEAWSTPIQPPSRCRSSLGMILCLCREDCSRIFFICGMSSGFVRSRLSRGPYQRKLYDHSLVQRRFHQYGGTI